MCGVGVASLLRMRKGRSFNKSFKNTKTDTALTAMNTRDWYMLYYTMHTVPKQSITRCIITIIVHSVKLSIANIKINQK